MPGAVSLVPGAWSIFSPAPAKIASGPFTTVRQNPGLWWPPSSSPDTTALPSLNDGERMIIKTPEPRGRSCHCWLWCPLSRHGVCLTSPYWSRRLLWRTCCMGLRWSHALELERPRQGHICYRLTKFSFSTSFTATSPTESDTCSWVVPSNTVLCCWKDT